MHTMPATLSQFDALGVVSKSGQHAEQCPSERDARQLTVRVNPAGDRAWQAALNGSFNRGDRGTETSWHVCWMSGIHTTANRQQG